MIGNARCGCSESRWWHQVEHVGPYMPRAKIEGSDVCGLCEGVGCCIRLQGGERNRTGPEGRGFGLPVPPQLTCCWWLRLCVSGAGMGRLPHSFGDKSGGHWWVPTYSTFCRVGTGQDGAKTSRKFFGKRSAFIMVAEILSLLE